MDLDLYERKERVRGGGGEGGGGGGRRGRGRWKEIVSYYPIIIAELNAKFYE